MSRKAVIGLSLLLAIAILGFFIYRVLVPAGPVLDPVDNPVRDRATLSKDLDESSIERNPQRNLYWGDLHVHTNMSFDAYIGGASTSPDEAYEFAQGNEIEIFGMNVKIDRPLDFAAVTDHSEFMGELYSVQHADAPGYYAAMAMYFRSIGLDTVKMREMFNRAAASVKEGKRTHLPFFKGFETTKSAWSVILESAEKHYKPGEFTTLAAYEWTLGAAAKHIHRNVFFRDMRVPDYPVSAIEAGDENALWAALEEFTAGGSTVMAIPHNSNLSLGHTFLDKTPESALIQNKYEPLVEVHQAKGNSEVHAKFWQNDEFADFENYAFDPAVEKSYVRDALKRGLAYEAEFGVNPFKFGMIGSTDTHNGTPGNTEEWSEFIGNHSLLDYSNVTRRTRDWILEFGSGKKVYDAVNPGGLVAVWAEANTRGDIYDAMKRRETYATSGGRIKVRFFAGYDFEESYDSYDQMVEEGYSKGVAMGSDIAPKAGSSPQFIIWASKDPEGANLDRVQVIKAWYDGESVQEKIFNVVMSDGRSMNADGSTQPNTATVNMETGEWDKDKGAVELKIVWTDPEFNPDQKAFYYLRVLENPTARYTLWDQIRYGTVYPDTEALTVQERAWSSPIWYSPN